MSANLNTSQLLLQKIYSHDQNIKDPVSRKLLSYTERLADIGEISSSPIVTVAKQGRAILPRYIFNGPPSGGKFIKIALFATIRGDEPETTENLIEYIKQLALRPELALGYTLYLYPIVNPTGLAQNTPYNKNGKLIEDELWKDSDEAEPYLIERELAVINFNGIISLYNNNETPYFDSYVREKTLYTEVLQPATEIANRYLLETAKDQSLKNTTFGARHKKILTQDHHLSTFEIVFRAPKNVPPNQRKIGVVQALHTILDRYRQFISFGQHL